MQLRRIAIIGTSGFLGKKVHKTLQKVYPDVFGTSFTNQKSGLYHLDVTNEEEIKTFIKQFSPKVIIYIVGETDLGQVETNPKKAIKLNTDAIDYIGKYFKGHFIYISTDYVFDGTTPPYNIDTTPHPLNKYGETKLIGEQKTLSNFKKSTIIRCGLFYGYNNPADKPNFVKQIIEKLDQGEKIVEDNLQIRHPVLIDDVANLILLAVQKKIYGILQINGKEAVTKYDLARLIADVYFHTFPQMIRKQIVGARFVDIQKRPKNAHLVNNSPIDPTPLKEGLQKIIRRISSRLKGGSYSRTFKFQKDDLWFVRKEAFGEGRAKLIKEINWLLGLKGEVKSYFPQVLNFDVESDLVFYEMPFYEMPTLTQWILDEGMDAATIIRKLNSILSFYLGQLITHRQQIPPADYIEKFLIQKIRDRIAETQRKAPLVFTDLIAAETLVINGKQYKNILPLLDKITSDSKILTILQPPFLTLIHGDLHLDNILINFKTDQFILLDSRGDHVGDPVYDVAKILHTIVGKYDILNYDLHQTTIKKQTGKITVKLTYPTTHPIWKVYKSLEEQVPIMLKNFYLSDNIRSQDPNLLQRLAFTHAALFASDMPFHLKGDNREERAVAIYITGVILLNKFMSLMRGERKTFLGFPIKVYV